MECDSELDSELPTPAEALESSSPLEDESRRVADAHTLKVKDSNKQNDFSSQFLNFLNNAQEEEEHIKDITDDDVPNKVDDDEVEHKKETNENKKVETKVAAKKAESPGSSDKENKV